MEENTLVDYMEYAWDWYYLYTPPCIVACIGLVSDQYPLGKETKVKNDITRSIYEFVISTGNIPTYSGGRD